MAEELGHMVQQRSTEAPFKQNQRACVAAKMLQILTRILYIHAQITLPFHTAHLVDLSIYVKIWQNEHIYIQYILLMKISHKESLRY